MTNRLWELLALYWQNELSAEERNELERLLLEHPDAWLKSGLLDQLSFKKAPVMNEEEADDWAGKMAARITQMEEEAAMISQSRKLPADEIPVSTKRRKLLPKILAGLCVLLFAAGGVYLYSLKKQGGMKVVTTDAGMKTRVRLSDGTMMWLNAGSTAKYPHHFDKDRREVHLSGEAFFEVAQDANRPFIIHTEKMDIRVLGTSFNVRSYKDERFAETTLITGAVEVAVPGPDSIRKVLLKPSEKLVVSELTGIPAKNSLMSKNKQQTILEQKKIAPFPTQNNELITETAWLSNQLIFQNETLESISHRLERWYGIHVMIGNRELAEMRFSGRADNLPLEKLLSVLSEIQAFKYTIRGDSVIIN